jgi:hypothetical protein
MRRERIRIMNVFNTLLLNRNSLIKEMVCVRSAMITSRENNSKVISVPHGKFDSCRREDDNSGEPHRVRREEEDEESKVLLHTCNSGEERDRQQMISPDDPPNSYHDTLDQLGHCLQKKFPVKLQKIAKSLFFLIILYYRPSKVFRVNNVTKNCDNLQ